MPNGDYLAIDPETEAISYLSHDSESKIVCGSLIAFLEAWQHLAYAGPETWIIERFIGSSSGYLVVPDSDRAGEIQKLFGKNEA